MKKKEIKKEEPKKEKKAKKVSVEANVPEEVTEGIVRIATGYSVKFGAKKEVFEGDERTALNEAVKRYIIFLTE